MITFMILLLTIAILAVVTIFVVSILGAGGIILFGDVIICIWLLSKIAKKKWKKWF